MAQQQRELAALQSLVPSTWVDGSQMPIALASDRDMICYPLLVPTDTCTYKDTNGTINLFQRKKKKVSNWEKLFPTNRTTEH